MVRGHATAARVRAVAVALTLAVSIASCSRSTSTDQDQAAAAVDATTTVPPSTTVPWTPGAEVAAWEEFIGSYEVLDVSKVSTGECGSRAMLVTEESLTTYWWDGQRWNDDSVLLAGGRGRFPLKVHTHDYTNDGVLDFFVVYADEDRPRSRTFGALFAYPWAQEDLCDWAWVDINNGRSTTKTLASPDVDPRDGTIRAQGYTRRRTSVRGEYRYLPSTGALVYQEAVKSDR